MTVNTDYWTLVEIELLKSAQDINAGLDGLTEEEFRTVRGDLMAQAARAGNIAKHEIFTADRFRAARKFHEGFPLLSGMAREVTYAAMDVAEARDDGKEYLGTD